jgi:hypothetical protein
MCCTPTLTRAQETAARGVSLVYARGGGSLRSQLLSQLVGVLQGNNAGTASISGVKGAALTGDTKWVSCVLVIQGYNVFF